MDNRTISSEPKVGLKIFYITTMFFITLSGFAQLPIFKRYYLADVPGLGWLDQFYVTHYIHYLSAVALLGIVFYKASEYLLFFRKTHRITASGFARVTFISGLILTGVFMALKNFPGYWFSKNTIIVLDMAHIALTVFYLFAAMLAVFSGKKWIEKL